MTCALDHDRCVISQNSSNSRGLLYVLEIVQLEIMCRVTPSTSQKSTPASLTVCLHLAGITQQEMALKHHLPEEMGHLEKILSVGHRKSPCNSLVREAQEKGVGVNQSIVTKYSGPVLGTSTMIAGHQEIDLRPTRKLSLLAGFHNPRRCSANCWGREAANSPVERGPLQVATLTCRQRCTHGCDRDRRFRGDHSVSAKR